MNGFDEVVREGFDARLREITAAGGVPPTRARSVVRAIRRRRVVRAGTATGASAFAIGALALGAMNLRSSGEATPGGVPLPTAGAYPWCDLASYPAVNPAALGAYPYAGRIYVNEADHEYVYVAPDGTKTTLQPDADGTYFATSPSGQKLRAPVGFSGGRSWSHMVWDIGIDGNGGGRAYFVTPDEPPFFTTVGPGLLSEWTTSTSGDAPAGVSAAGILDYQLQSIGFPAYTAPRPFVPAGAALEQVLRWSDGRERVTGLKALDTQAPLVEGDDLVGLVSVSLRVVGLPDGATYQVTSAYDPTKTWAAACGTDLDLRSPTPTQSRGTTLEGTGTVPTPSATYATPAPSSSADALAPNSSPAPTP